VAKKGVLIQPLFNPLRSDLCPLPFKDAIPSNKFHEKRRPLDLGIASFFPLPSALCALPFKDAIPSNKFHKKRRPLDSGLASFAICAMRYALCPLPQGRHPLNQLS